MKKYKCTECGNIKDLLINHDGLPEVWERCTDHCMWTNTDRNAPVLRSQTLYKKNFDGTITQYTVETGFRKRKYVRIL